MYYSFQGLLLGYRDRLVKLVREERTDIFQDYASLLAAVLTNLAAQLAEPKSISAEDIVPHLSFLMDNSFLFTPEGLWPIVLSVVALVKSTVHVAPTVGILSIGLLKLLAFLTSLLSTIL